MDEFLKVFGDITISTVAVVIVALVFLWKLYTIVKNHLIEKYKQEEEKEKKSTASYRYFSCDSCDRWIDHVSVFV